MHRSTLVALLLWTSGFTVAVGGMSAQRSHAVLSADEKRILVMVSPKADYDAPHPVAFSLPDGRTVVLRDTFKNQAHTIPLRSPRYGRLIGSPLRGIYVGPLTSVM